MEEIHREPAAVRNFDPAELRVGARVRLVDISGEATVMEPPDRRGRVAVRAGGLRMVVPLDRVEGIVTPDSPSRGPGRVNVGLEPEPDTLEIACDLRGLRVDEALERAEAHLLRMRANGIHEVRLIHGHGTGALREAIRSWLRELEWIRSFSRAPQELGGDGVTIATLSS